MIYQNILNNGRGYGKPHVTKMVKSAYGWNWIANYRGCYSHGVTPSDAVTDVLAFYDKCFPGVREAENAKCDYCKGGGKICVGMYHGDYFQPPEPELEDCPDCSGSGLAP